MSTETPEQLRQRMEERKRVTLTEGRQLLDRLDEAMTEIARLQDQLAHDGAQPAPADTPAEATTTRPEERPIPEGLRGLLEQSSAAAESQGSDSLAAALYRWCDDWLTVRAQLETLIHTEQQTQTSIERLEQEAETLTHRLSAWINEQRG